MTKYLSKIVKGNDEILIKDLEARGLLSVMGASGSGHKSGLVPDPGATAGTTKYLREDGTWVAPSVSVAPEGIGFGIGTCSTAGTTAAKEVSISNFIPTKYGIVTVFFTNAILSQNSTLNVNNTGAKAIKLYGSQLNPDVIKARTTLVLQYDGTAYEIISMSKEEEYVPESELWVDLGLPSGVKWAKTNIDLSQQNGFASSEYSYECSRFSWGNIDNHELTGTTTFSPWSWGVGVDGNPYLSSNGAKLTGNITISHDAARIKLGGFWRVPSSLEFQDLFDGCDFVDENDDVIPAATANKLITMNNVVGIRLKSKTNGNHIFFPCTGYGIVSDLRNKDVSGYYWSSTYYNNINAMVLIFHSGGVVPQAAVGSRFWGLPIRPVI